MRMTSAFRAWSRFVSSGLAIVAGVGCGANGDDVAEVQSAAKPGSDASAGDTADGDAADGETSGGGGGLLCASSDTSSVNTFIEGNKALQIDLAPDNETSFGNANLVVGGDSDGSASYDLPSVAGAVTPYIDWSTLAADSTTLARHRLLDIFSAKDPSAFPGNSSCVGAANNPAKDELLYAGAANNNAFLYLNVLRASNLGDMGYTWLFTKEKPSCEAGGNNCDNWLRYTLSPGDVLVFGHFRTDGTKLLLPYRYAGSTPTTVDATAAIDWGAAAGLWTPSSAAAYAAVNTDESAPGGWGLAGLKNVVANGTAIEDHVFAEGAISTDVFGAGGVCGRSFWTSVISKSSGNTSSGADVKDLIGPKRLNFGSLTGAATVTPKCDGTVDLSASGKDANGNALTTTCVWKEGSTVISSKCVENVALTGAHTLSVTITDTSNAACAQTVDGLAVEAHAAPTVTPSMTATCSLQIDYDASTSNTYGAAGDVTVGWSFDHGIGARSGAKGSLTSLTAGTTYGGTVTVTDERPDGQGGTITCTASQTASATPQGPIVPSLNVAPASLSCSSSPKVQSSANTVTFTASGSGGVPPYTYTWTGCSAKGGTTDTTCEVDGDAALCSTQSVSVIISDASGSGSAPKCAATSSLSGRYSEVKTITATVP